jgi:uncharacterized integral membrane protein
MHEVPIVMLLLGMVSSIAIVAFALQNGRIVTVGFFDWSVEASLVLVIMVSALMGFVTAIFFELFIQIKLRYRMYKMGRQIKQFEEEVQRLRKMAVAPESSSTPVDKASDSKITEMPAT